MVYANVNQETIESLQFLAWFTLICSKWIRYKMALIFPLHFFYYLVVWFWTVLLAFCFSWVIWNTSNTAKFESFLILTLIWDLARLSNAAFYKTAHLIETISKTSRVGIILTTLCLYTKWVIFVWISLLSKQWACEPRWIGQHVRVTGRGFDLSAGAVPGPHMRVHVSYATQI